jgi:hypothetical protein
LLCFQLIKSKHDVLGGAQFVYGRIFAIAVACFCFEIAQKQLVFHPVFVCENVIAVYIIGPFNFVTGAKCFLGYCD